MLNCTDDAVVFERITCTDAPLATDWLGTAKLPTLVDTSNPASAAPPNDQPHRDPGDSFSLFVRPVAVGVIEKSIGKEPSASRPAQVHGVIRMVGRSGPIVIAASNF